MAILKILTTITTIAAITLATPTENEELQLVCPEEEGACKIVGALEFDNLIEGDIIPFRESGLSRKNAVVSSFKKWPNNTVPYVFDEKFTSNERRTIKVAIRFLEDETCVKFVEYTATKAETKRPTLLYILTGEGCSGTVGFNRKKNYAILNQKHCLEPSGKIHHELLHVLGLKHEHVRHDRDDYVEILFQNIQPGMESNFNKVDNKSYTTYGLDYDYYSVMHYPTNFFAIDKSKDTLLPKNFKVSPHRLGQREAASELDLEKINLMYNCPEKYLKYVITSG